jgi:hypothetical protein
MTDQSDTGLFTLEEPATLTFPDNLFTARAIGPKGKEQGTPKFSSNFEFAPDSADLKRMKAQAVAVAREKWPDRDLKELKFPFSSGDKLADKATAKGKDREFSRGKVVVAARSKYPPRLSAVIDGKLVEFTDDTRATAKARFYFGVNVLAQFNLVAYDGVGANPDGVTAYLNMVCSLGTGDRLSSGGASAAEVFKGYAGHLSEEDPTGGAGLDLDDEIPF